MTDAEVKKAIEKKTLVSIRSSCIFYNKPTIILSFCGNPDFVNVLGSDDAYETYRIFEYTAQHEIKALKDSLAVMREGMQTIIDHLHLIGNEDCNIPINTSLTLFYKTAEDSLNYLESRQPETEKS